MEPWKRNGLSRRGNARVSGGALEKKRAQQTRERNDVKWSLGEGTGSAHERAQRCQVEPWKRNGLSTTGKGPPQWGLTPQHNKVVNTASIKHEQTMRQCDVMCGYLCVRASILIYVFLRVPLLGLASIPLSCHVVSFSKISRCWRPLPAVEWKSPR